MLSLQTLLATESAQTGDWTKIFEYLPLIVGIICGVILLSAFFVGFKKGARRISWTGVFWLLAALGFFLIEKLAFKDGNPMLGWFAPLTEAMDLTGETATKMTAFMASFALALACVLVSLLLYGVCSLAFRPKTKRVRRVSDAYSLDEDGVEYDEEFEDYDDYENYKSRREVMYKGYGRPSFFGRLGGGIICVLNTAMIVAVVLAVLLFAFHNTPLKDGPLSVLYETEAVNVLVKFASDYALDMVFIGIVVGFACMGRKKGFMETLRTLIVNFGSIAAVIVCFCIPFSPLALPREQGGDYFISEFVNRCVEAGATLFGGNMPEVSAVVGKLLAGLILSAFVIVVIVLLNIILKKLVRGIDGVGFFRMVDGALAGVIYMLLGVVVASLVWGVWYILTYYGIFYADSLFTTESSISSGLFHVGDVYLKPLIEMITQAVSDFFASFSAA